MHIKKDKTIIGRYGKPEGVDAMVLWLCSEDAGAVLGQGMAVDGGYTIK